MEKNNDAKVQEKYDYLKGKYMNRVSAFALTVSATLLPLMGFFPGIIMNMLADMGQGFMQVKEAGEIAYFSPGNLRGGFISVLIGIIVYFAVVRTWLIRMENGKTVYLNRWNPYLDLEDTIYRPVLLKFLPFVCGIVCRVLDSLVDTVVVALRKTVYRDSKLPHELEEGNAVTHMLGCVANMLEKAGNSTIRKKKQKNVDYEHKFALIHEELAEDKFIIRRSMSFGLLMFCIGLLITVAYLLVLK